METKLKRWVYLFILLQPFLDIFWLYQPPISTAMGMSPATIIRLLFVLIIGVLYILCLKNKKELWFYSGYILLLGVYFIFHQKNAMLFHSPVSGNFGYSTFGELFYIVRMVIPLFMIIVATKTKYSDKQFEYLINWLTLFFSGSIVLTNLFGISLGSYQRNWGQGSLAEQYGNQKIYSTILNWFQTNHAVNFTDMASKGFFNHANTTSVILILLTPLIFYVVIKHFNWKNSLLMLVHLLACQEIGTKTAGYGSVLLLAGYLVVYLFFVFVKKEFKFNKFILIFFSLALLGAYGLNTISPNNNRQVSETHSEQQLIPKKGHNVDYSKKLIEVKKNGSKQAQIRFIYKYRNNFGLNDKFVTANYPAKADPSFWLKVMQWPSYQRINYRYLQMQIWKRVAHLNNNPKDKWLGFGYTRLNNMGLIERDFYSQYYAMGIIGMILLVIPYLLVVAYAGIKMLFNYRKAFTLKNVSLLIGIIMMLAISLYSGYVLDYLTATILLGFFMGQLLQGISMKKTNSLDKV